MCAGLTIWAQKPQDDNRQNIDSYCDHLMHSFTLGKYHEAVQSLKDHSVINAVQIDTLESQVTTQMAMVSSIYGTTRAFEFIKEKAIKDFLVKRYYVLLFDHYYLKFEFTLYKAKNGWTVTSFVYNEDINSLFQ
jgi:hypothetical protein